jgi:predicted CoA-binding protein
VSVSNRLSDDELRTLLTDARTVAVVGANPKRPSNAAIETLVAKGYEVFPINPLLTGKTVHGRTVLESLSAIGRPMDIVDIFRRSADVGPAVDEAIATGARCVWMPLDVINEAAAAKARAAGLTVVMDSCIAIEIKRLGL